MGTVVALPLSGLLASTFGWPSVFYVFGEILISAYVGCKQKLIIFLEVINVISSIHVVDVSSYLNDHGTVVDFTLQENDSR